ncbi:MAG TPA: cupin domain-containing protein [Streptosporangiaceae bacterium]|nr:cupin domain-containing protein [Streptosporangiaceae bacterium]
MDDKISLSEALATFDEIYSPRIVGRVNDYDLKVAHAKGDYVWHVHADTDEFFLVIDGRFDIELRDADGGERRVELHAGDVFVVPKGIAHKPSSPGSAILMFEPSGTLSTGDRHDGPIPDYVDSTTGHEFTS